VPAHFGPPECVVITDRSSVAAGGIASFHPLSKAVRLKDCDRLCGSLDVPDSFRRLGTRPFGVPFTRDPLHSAVWTFLPPSLPLRAERRARIRIPRYPIIIAYQAKPRRNDGVFFGTEISVQNLRCTDLIHTGSTNRTFSFHCGFTIFHGYLHCFRIFALRAAFDTIHACHSLHSPPFKKSYIFPLPNQ